MSVVCMPELKTKKQTRLPTEIRQREVVDTVVGLAGRHSPEGITTQAIAQQMGITHGALFRHFPNKQAMWQAVFVWVEEELGGILSEAEQGGGSPLEVLARIFRAHVKFVAKNPGVPRILLHELQQPTDTVFHAQVQKMVGGYQSRLRALLCDAKRSGQLPTDLDEEAAAVLFLGTVQGLVIQSMLFDSNDGMEAAAGRIFPLLLNGFRGNNSGEKS